MRRSFSLVLAAISALVLLPLLASAAPTDVDARRKALNDLLAERWEYSMKTSPIYASVLGDKRYNDLLDDGSQKAIDSDLERAKTDLAKFAAVDTSGFPEQEVLNISCEPFAAAGVIDIGVVVDSVRKMHTPVG